MYRKIESFSSMRFGTVLIILAVLASALTVVFLLHTETDDSTALVIDCGRCGDDIAYSYSSDGTLVISGTGGMYDYSGMNSPWYKYGYCITKVVIGDGVTSLGEWAFLNCANINELTIPITLDSVRSNEHPSFAGCTNIERITLTYGSNGYGCDYYAYAVDGSWYQNTPWYQSRDSLKELNLADNVKGIGSDAFRELNISSLVIPETVVIVGNYAFFNCTKLTDLTIPISLKPFFSESVNGISPIKYPSFEGCIAVEKITFTRGNGVPFDYDEPYYRTIAPWNMYPDVGKTIIISENIDKLGKCMFKECNIVDLTVPDSTVYNSKSVFEKSKNIVNVKITKCTVADYTSSSANVNELPWHIDWAPTIKNFVFAEGVTRIPSGILALREVENLVLPNTLVSFGDYSNPGPFSQITVKHLTIPITLNAVWFDSWAAFRNVSGIEKITFTPGDSGIGFNYAAYEDMNCWYQNTPWYQCRSTLKEIVFEDGIKSIGSDAFRELNINSVVIPDSVQSLGNHTFFLCEKLKYLTIPITLDSVFSDQYPAFNQCFAIDTLRLTAGNSGIGFDYSGQLPIWCSATNKPSTIVFGSGITYIGSHTFDGYTFLGADGSTLQSTGDDLSGHTYNGVDGVMYQVDSPQSAETPVSTEDCSAQDVGSDDAAVQQADDVHLEASASTEDCSAQDVGSDDTAVQQADDAQSIDDVSDTRSSIRELVAIETGIIIGIGACFGICRRTTVCSKPKS